jgi:hypothetical protein
MSTIKYNQVNITEYKFPTLEETVKKIKSNKNASKSITILPTLFDKTKMNIQLPWIRHNSYGIPNDKYLNTDELRMHIKLPVSKDSLNNEFTEFEKTVKSWDEYFGSDEFKTLVFENKKSKYEYTPILKTPQENDEKPDEVKPNYIKFKFDTNYINDNGKFIMGDIKTEIYKTETVDNKKTRERIENIKKIDDLKNLIKFNSNIRLIVRLNKLWTKSEQKGMFSYGIALKVHKLEFELSNNQYGSVSGDFLDDEEVIQVATKPKNVVKKLEEFKIDSDNSDDEDEIKVVENKKSVNKNNIYEVETSDDDEESDNDDDESEELPKKVVPQKKVINNVSDDSEEELPKKVVPQKKANKNISDDEEDPGVVVVKSKASKSKKK